jgi:hypothetical protein
MLDLTSLIHDKNSYILNYNSLIVENSDVLLGFIFVKNVIGNTKYVKTDAHFVVTPTVSRNKKCINLCFASTCEARKLVTFRPAIQTKQSLGLYC